MRRLERNRAIVRGVVAGVIVVVIIVLVLLSRQGILP